MKKGNYFPRSRARWQSSRYGAGEPAFPTWIKFTDGVWTYFNVASGSTEVINPWELHPGRWGYVPTFGMVLYRGRWGNGIKTGRWELGYYPTWPGGCHASFAIWFQAGVGPDNAFWIQGTGAGTIDTIWQPGVDFPLGNFVTISKDYPWITSTVGLVQALSYSEIVALGEDPNDTKPRTWSDDFGPP